MRLRIFVAFAVILMSYVPLIAASQPPSSSPQKAKRTPKAAPRIVRGNLSAIDKSSLIVTVKDRFGNKKELTLTDKTRYTIAHKPAELTDFKIDAPVVIHLTHSRSTGSDLVSEMCDPGSWLWLEKQRKTTQTGPITELNDEELVITVAGEKVTYRHTSKTLWSKDGKSVAATDFKVGESATVVPRSLPGGGFMARIVTDSAASAMIEKRKSSKVHAGVVTAIDLERKSIAIRDKARILSTYRYDETTTIWRTKKPAQISDIHVGSSISLSTKPGPDDRLIITRIVIKVPKK